MTRMRQSLGRILDAVDVTTLAGIRTVLGIELSDSHAVIAEVWNTARSLNRFKPRFWVGHRGVITFDGHSTHKERGSSIHSFLSSSNIRTRFAVAALQSTLAKTVSLEIPQRSEGSEHWIARIIQDRVPLPVPLEELTYRYELCPGAGTVRRLEITLVRKSELELWKSVLECAGITLLAITIGARDACNALYFSSEISRGDVKRFIYVQKQAIWSFSLDENKRITAAEKITLSPTKEKAGGKTVEEASAPQFSADGTVVSGETSSVRGAKIIGVLETEPQYTLAIGAAIRGFVPTLGSRDFLTEEKRKSNEEAIFKAAVQRTGVACAILLVLFFSFTRGLSYLIRTQIHHVENQLQVSSAAFGEIAGLERTIHQLQHRVALESESRNQWNSNLAFTMHEVATACPHGITLSSLRVVREDTAYNLSITGGAESNDMVATFLQALQGSAHLRAAEVKLVRSGSADRHMGRPNTDMAPTRRTVFFELQAGVQ